MFATVLAGGAQSILFVLMLYVKFTIFQPCWDDFLSCWDEPVLSKDSDIAQ